MGFTHFLQAVYRQLTVAPDTLVRMARTGLLTALAAALFAVPVALPADTPADGTLSVKRGRGAIMLKFRGTVIGRLNGRVQVRDFRPFDYNTPELLGCKPRIRHRGFAVSICKGRRISFRILDGRFNVNVHGGGIFLSAVGRGSVTVDGKGELGINDGVYSLNDAPYESLPDSPTTLLLQPPPPGG